MKTQTSGGSFATPYTRRKYLPLAAVLLALLLVSAAAVAFLTLNKQSSEISVQYLTEGGTGQAKATVDSPLTALVRIPWQGRSQAETLSAATLQFLDDQGKPAEFGGKPSAASILFSTTDMSLWEYRGAVPSKPGTYRARLQLSRLSGNLGPETPETIELPEPKLIAVAESSPPLRTGFVFNKDPDLWILSTDATRQRRLTFLTGVGERALDPAWSPDGKQLAFTYLPALPADALPQTDIWTINPDGTGMKVLVKARAEETLSKPSWSSDGRTLYFSVDRMSNQPLGPGAQKSEFDRYRRIDRLDLETGARSEVLKGAQSPAVGGAEGGLVYFRDSTPVRPEDGTVQELMYMPPGGEPVLVMAGGFSPEMVSPRLSPDGAWVAFSAINPNMGEMGESMDFFRWLTFAPSVAYAHETLWELYLVPFRGGKPVRLTRLDEDQLSPVWMDASTITFLGQKGLQKLVIDSTGKPVGSPAKIANGERHGTLTWYEP